MSWDTSGGGGSWNDGGNSKSFNDASTRGTFNDASNGGGFDAVNVGAAGGENGGSCFNCGQDGHIKSECPESPKRSGGCFNCGEDGHNKSDCPNPTIAREFSGTCRACGQEGHRRSDCPDAPLQTCRNCLEEGHMINDCKNPRRINRDHIPTVLPEAAWSELKVASVNRDLDDMRDAIDKYVKGNPELTYLQLEEAFRNQDINCYIIAMQRELAITYTNMDLQGNLGKKYSVSYRLSDKPKRPKENEGWPTPADNLERLKDAGEPVDVGVPKCSNCNNLGHTFKACEQEKQENADRAVVKCYNCEEIGHRVRDCPISVVDKFACRNCKQSGHTSKECPEPRSAEGVECRKCGETGHFGKECPNNPQGGSGCRNCGQDGHMAKECPEPRNPLTMKCRNCDEMGHSSRECPLPRDYSRVQCQNCQEMGHTKVRCKKPVVADGAATESGGDNFGNSGEAGFGAASSGGDDAWASNGAGAAPSGGDDWATAPPAASTSGW